MKHRPLYYQRPVPFRWITRQFIWEMRTSHIQACIPYIDKHIHDWKFILNSYRRNQKIERKLVVRRIRYNLVVIARFKRELALRKEYPQYRAFTNFFFMNRDDMTSRLVCADLLDEIGKHVLARKMRLAAEGRLQ